MDGSSSSWMEETSYVDGDEEEDFEVEDAVDNEPMHVVEKLYLGSIDAAMNTAALTRCRIAHVLALLGATDAQDCAVVPTGDGDSSAAPVGGADVCIKRTQIAMEDSHEEPLLLRLPSVLEQLELALKDAEARGGNVLVHCIAGRSRSPAVVAAWIMTHKNCSLDDAVNTISAARPWIAMNSHFQNELRLFSAILSKTLSVADVSCLQQHALPRLDFGASLVEGILANTKTITMRLPSDVDMDCNSDLSQLCRYSIAVATTEGEQVNKRLPFALVRIDQVDRARSLDEIDATILSKTGFSSTPELLAILQRFYPSVTSSTPLMMLHLTCVARV